MDLLLNQHYHDLNPLSFGHEVCVPGHDCGPTIRQYYLIHCVLRGRGIFEHAGRIWPVSAGMIFLIRPDEVCYYRADETDPWEYTWIGFDGILARTFDQMDPPVCRIDSSLFTDMMAAVERCDNPEPFLASGLHQLRGLLFSDRQAGSRDYVGRVVNYINAMYMQDITVERIAAMLSLDRRYLSRLFKEKRGMTIRDYLTHVRIERACALLRTGMTVGEASRMVGCPDAANFSKLFHSHRGVSPKQYQLSCLDGEDQNEKGLSAGS